MQLLGTFRMSAAPPSRAEVAAKPGVPSCAAVLVHASTRSRDPQLIALAGDASRFTAPSQRVGESPATGGARSDGRLRPSNPELTPVWFQEPQSPSIRLRGGIRLDVDGQP